MGLIPGLGKSGVGNGNSLQYSCLENQSHGQRSLVGYSPWGHRTDITEHSTAIFLRRVYFPGLLMLKLAGWLALTTELLPNVPAYLDLPPCIYLPHCHENFPQEAAAPSAWAQKKHTWKQSWAQSAEQPTPTGLADGSRGTQVSPTPANLQLCKRQQMIILFKSLLLGDS